MGETAVRVIQTAHYNNLGTVEFLVDKNKNFYFLEVNARIQVEHPITEMTTGVDLVKLQVRIAEGEKLPFSQSDLSQNGHAIECRIYAEDSDNNFMPSSGTILFLKEPIGPGVRYDSGIFTGAVVPVFYDPVMAKLICWGRDREEARGRMINALKENVILGVKTSTGFMRKVLEHPEFINGNTFTDFIDKNMSQDKHTDGNILNAALAGAAVLSGRKKSSVQAEGANGEIPSPWISIGKWEIAGGKL
jgi:acetyl-CoA carboxylase biotin carboxylase subunit